MVLYRALGICFLSVFIASAPWAQIRLGEGIKARIEAALERVDEGVRFVDADLETTSFVDQVEGQSGVVRFVTDFEGVDNYLVELGMGNFDFDNNRALIRIRMYGTELFELENDAVGSFELAEESVPVPTKTGYLDVGRALIAIRALSDAIRNQAQ